MNQLTGGDAPVELLSQAQTLEGLAGIFSNDALVMVIKGIMGANMWVYQVELSEQDIIEFSTTEMQNFGCTLTEVELTETGSVLTFTKEGVIYFMIIEADASSSGKTYITLMDMTGYSP